MNNLYAAYMRIAGFTQTTTDMLKNHSEWGFRDGMHHANNRGNKVIPLAILSRILYSTIMRNPSLHIKAKGLRMIVLVLLRGLPCFHRMVHPIPIHPDFCTC